jgi:hypothetical protein
MIHALPHGQIHHARVETVYPLIEAGSATLVHSDGPYGLDKAAWDKVRDLAAWYRPHIAEWGRICAPSASVYLWNTAEGWAAIHPEMVVAGWTSRGLITWDKLHTPAQLGAARVTGPLDTTEVCGVYTRGAGRADASVLGFSVWQMAEQAYRDERLRSTVATPDRNPLRGLTFSALHPCQKPLLFARRIVEASSRPGDLVFEPFGGTCRIAAACEDIARWEPEKARRYVCVEMDEDGRDYVPAVLASLRGETTASGHAAGQVELFRRTA